MPLFPQQQLFDLVELATDVVGEGYVDVRRSNHLGGIDPLVVGNLPRDPAPIVQLRSDIISLNEPVTPAGPDGAHPLIVWIRNAAAFNGPHPRSVEFAEFLEAPGVVGDGGNREAVFEACRDRWNTHPLLDRTGLRDWLRRRVKNEGFPVVSVSGAPRSGKSISAEFVQLVASTYGFDVIVVDVRQVSLEEFKPDDLAKTIAAQLAIDAPIPRREDYASGSRWLTDIQLWLLRHLGTRVQSTWLVLDHFDDDNVRADTRQLVRQLEQPSQNEKIPPLIVLGYESPGGARAFGNAVPREETRRLERSDVSKYYERRIQAERPEIEKAKRDELVQSYTDTVFHEVSPEYSAEELVDAIQSVDEAVSAGVSR